MPFKYWKILKCLQNCPISEKYKNFENWYTKLITSILTNIFNHKQNPE